MDLSDPTRAVTSTLDGTVLAVLAVAGRPLTVGQVARQAVRGSEIGIRRSLDRLVEQGIVRATLMGRNLVHELNREHLAAEVAVLLAGLRTELWRRLRDELGSWPVEPLYAGVFGSAARGDGDVDSDIDLLLVHPQFARERRPDTPRPPSPAAAVETVDSAVRSGIEADPALQTQTDRLRGLVLAWTGNRSRSSTCPSTTGETLRRSTRLCSTRCTARACRSTRCGPWLPGRAREAPMPRAKRTRPATLVDARTRLEVATAYLEVASRPGRRGAASRDAQRRGRTGRPCGHRRF